MEADSALELLLAANQLKRVPRAGWVMRGVADAESVSDHTFGVAFVSLILAHMVEQSLDTAKVLTIALLHDLPEAVLGDIPNPASRYLPPHAKRGAEEQVLHALLQGAPQGEQWSTWWREYEDGTTLEARLVHDADRIDMLIQAYVYAQTTGNRWLDEFWAETTADTFELEESRSLFDALRRARGHSGRHREAG